MGSGRNLALGSEGLFIEFHSRIPSAKCCSPFIIQNSSPYLQHHVCAAL